MNRKMPVLFIGHGSPMNAIEDNQASRSWTALGKDITDNYGKPKAIVVVSAHWATKGTYVRVADKNPQIYDMYGFPQPLYDIKYEPPGEPGLAKRVLTMLDGIAVGTTDWGIDHGVWTELMYMYPDADIPVVIISTDMTSGPEILVEIGKRLQPLRDEQILVMASGNVVHNLRDISFDTPQGFPWANAFDESICDAIVNKQYDVPIHYTQLEGAHKAVPMPDHYYPLLAAIGAVTDEDTVSVWNDYREHGSLSMTSYRWDSKQ